MINIRNVFPVLLIILLVISTILLLYYKIDDKTIKEDDELADAYADSKMNALLNGSGINNIPNLNIVTTNSDIDVANKCASGPIKIQKDYISDVSCQKLCMSSNASSLVVNAGDHISYNNSELSAGVYCLLGDRPECNLQTTYAVMTLNSVVCYPKYPELFGGPTGDKVVACNDSNIYDAKNYLYDNLTQQRVYSPAGLYLTSAGADELMPDGSYRFVCKFKGEDVRGNTYIQHPLDRFHPMKNECAKLIYRAHPDVVTKYGSDGSRICDCGNIQETRVANIDPNDPSSLCSSIQESVTPINKDLQILNKPYPCYTAYSPFKDIGSMHPCPPDQFTREGNMIGKIELPMSYNLNAFISHAEYKSMTDGKFITRFD